MLPSSVTSHMQRDSLFVYQQDVDLTSELTAFSGLKRKGKRLAAHTQRGCGLGVSCGLTAPSAACDLLLTLTIKKGGLSPYSFSSVGIVWAD